MSRTANTFKTEYVAPESRYIVLQQERCIADSGTLKDMASNEIIDENID